MLYLGIDIGKNSHVATLIDENKTILFKTFSFPNSVEVAEFLIQPPPFFRCRNWYGCYRTLLAFFILFPYF